MDRTLEFFRFYFMAGVYIAAAVLAVSAVVALIEKIFGVDPTPKHILKLRALQGSRSDHDPVSMRSDFPPIR
jgi:hypothetical protein